MNTSRLKTKWAVRALLALLIGFIGFSMGILWEGRTEAGVFTIRTSQAYAPSVVTGQPAGLLDINKASALELADLPGIGPVLAGRIVEHRVEHGPFAAPEELISVKGVGESKLAQILPYIYVSGGAG